MVDDKIIAERYKGGESVRSIADSLGISISIVYVSLERIGVQRKSLVFPENTMMGVVEEYKTGRYTAAQVAKRFGVSESVVYKWVRQDREGVLGVKKERQKRESKVDIDKVVTLYRSGSGVRKIAETVGCSPTTVKHHLVNAGVYEGKEGGKLRHVANISRKGKFSNSEKVAIVSDYDLHNMSVTAIAEKYNTSRVTVRLILKEYGINTTERENLNVNKNGLRYSASKIISDYKTGLFSHAEIAKRYGVSTRTVSRILDKAGVEAMDTHRVVSSTEVARVLSDVRADLAGGLDAWSVAVKHGLPLRTVEKVVDGRYDNLRVTRSGETVVSYYKPVQREKRVVEKFESKGTKADRCRSQILELHALGKKPPAIAEELGLSSPTVRSVLKEAGVGKVKKQVEKKGTKSGRMRGDILRLHQEGKDAVRIAQELGVSAPTVRKVLSSAESHVATSVETHVETAVEPMTVAPSKFMVDMITNVWKRRGDVEAVAAETGLDVEMVKAILKKEVGV